MESIQKTGPKFNLTTYLAAREVVIAIVNKTASRMQEGMNFKDGIALIQEISEEYGVSKSWHPPKFRIGADTQKVFREKSDPNIKLKKDDLFFIDVGPVINGHEADYGQTFSIASTPLEKLKKAAQEVFLLTKKEWQSKGLTGEELYVYAQNQSKNFGYILNLDMGGHRLGDFPHGVFYKGDLSGFEKEPVANLWVLEILIKDPNSENGAFFEDIIF